MKKFIYILPLIVVIFSLHTSCKKDPVKPKLIFKFKFDNTQERLNNFGLPSTIPAGHGTQSPIFNTMSAHYIEISPKDSILLGYGEVLYRAEETTAGGANAIDFSKSILAKEGENFFSIDLEKIKNGTYKNLRVSLAYQNYDVQYKYSTYTFTGTIASFVGFNTYINSYKIKDQTKVINGNKLQGYWGFETNTLGAYSVSDGQAPVGATTVPNILYGISNVPAGSCVVTGKFDQDLVITGNETKDIVITVSISTNNSFEWNDIDNDNIFEPIDASTGAVKDVVVDMGVRGLKGKVAY